MTILKSDCRTISIVSDGRQQNRLNNYKYYNDGEVIALYNYNRNNVKKAVELALSWTHVPNVIDSKTGKIDVL